MAKRSAGLLLYRKRASGLEVLIVHPGGPFWAKKDLGAWSIPKGEYGEEEDPRQAAIREFEEETGVATDADGKFLPLGEIRQASAKLISVWAREGDLDARKIHSNTFSMEWPPKSGTMAEFPEVDRAEWVSIETAREKLVKGQVEFLNRLVRAIGGSGRD